MQGGNARHIYVGKPVSVIGARRLRTRPGRGDGDGIGIPFDAGAGRVFLRSMNTVTSRQVPARRLAVPNLLTYARIAAVPAVVACLYWQDILQGGLWLRWVALVIFILCREILVSGLREYLAELRVSVPVTQLAKWKTTLQLVAVGFLIAGEAGDAVVPVVTPIGLALLWLSALLTLYTGWDYFRAGVRHLTED